MSSISTAFMWLVLAIIGATHCYDVTVKIKSPSDDVSVSETCPATTDFKNDGCVQTICGPPPGDVVCGELKDTEGWTVIHRRLNGSVDFYRGWQEYEDGFGDIGGEFWLGLKKIHRLTMSGRYSLRVDLEDFQGNTAYAEYVDFFISGPEDNYRLYIDGFSGTAGNSLSHHINRAFSTKDRDNDDHTSHCARVYHGAWWYGACHDSNLNGLYRPSAQVTTDSIAWEHWKNQYVALKSAQMKIRPAT